MRLPDRHKAFTVIEVIAVLLIMGIFCAVAVTWMMGSSEADLRSQLEVVKGHLRVAQARALSTGNAWGINFASPATYFLFKGPAQNAPVQLLGEENPTVDLQDKGSELRITSAPQVITFDAYGSPGNSEITVSTNSYNITITRNTGFIP